jgi:hypothetical protein
MRPHGRAKVSTRNPQAFGICDRCGFLYNHTNLMWQFDWAGASLINKRILVCKPCNDVPQNQLRAIVLPADPVPIMNPRVEAYASAETDTRVIIVSSTVDPTTGLTVNVYATRVTEDGNPRVDQPIGVPTGLAQSAVMPLYANVKYGVELPILSITANGTTIVTVTCSDVHGLTTNDVVSIEGTSTPKADGFYNVEVTSATAFRYETNKTITSGSLQEVSTRIITAIVGVPYGFDQIPKTGI